jgi:hypothetical protein
VYQILARGVKFPLWHARLARHRRGATNPDTLSSSHTHTHNTTHLRGSPFHPATEIENQSTLPPPPVPNKNTHTSRPFTQAPIMLRQQFARSAMRQPLVLRSLRHLSGAPTSSHSGLKERLAELIPVEQARFKKIKQEHGDKVIGEVTVDQCIGGARSVKCMVWETSQLDPVEVSNNECCFLNGSRRCFRPFCVRCSFRRWRRPYLQVLYSMPRSLDGLNCSTPAGDE